MAIPIDYLSRVLMSRLHVMQASLVEFAGGFRMPENLVSAPKLLLVLSGQIVYRLENREYRLGPGTMFFRGSWTRASWHVAAAEEKQSSCLAYCEYQADVPEPGPLEPVLLDVSRERVERDAVQRMVSLTGDQGAASELLREAEAKAMLARFLVSVKTAPVDDTGGRVTARSDVIITEALRWLQQHFTDGDAVSKVPLGDLTAAHFRTRFHRRVGMSPRDYVTMLRMRSARYRIHQTQAPIKQIAFDLGYKDPLYFSRLYRRFWSWWPTEDRAASAPPTPASDAGSMPKPPKPS